MDDLKLHPTTIERLPIYFRYLNSLAKSGVKRVSSTELAKAIKVDSATIRRDFSYLGALGKRGYGYDVEYLLSYLAKTLNQEHLSNIALVGVGKLGSALLNYHFTKDNIRIALGFDVRNEIINTVQAGVPIYGLADLKEQIEIRGIEVAILAVPHQVAQEMTEMLLAAGIKGILNFTTVRLNVPADVRVQNINFANELQTLIYFLH